MGVWLRIALVALAYNIRKPTTIFGVARLWNLLNSVSKREKVLILDGGMIKQCSPGVQARNNAFRAQKVDRSCWISSSSHSSISHIVMDQLVKEPLSLAEAVPEVNFIAIALRKE